VEFIKGCLPDVASRAFSAIVGAFSMAQAPQSASSLASPPPPPASSPSGLSGANTRTVTYGLPGSVWARKVDESVSLALASTAFLREWHFKHGSNLPANVPHDRLVELAMHVMEHGDLGSIRDPTGGDQERAHAQSLPDKPIWAEKLAVPAQRHPLSSSYLTSSVSPDFLRTLLVPLFFSFYRPLDDGTEAKYNVAHLAPVFSSLSQAIFTVAEQMRPDGSGIQRLLWYDFPSSRGGVSYAT
jgi:hypothetical protein